MSSSRGSVIVAVLTAPLLMMASPALAGPEHNDAVAVRAAETIRHLYQDEAVARRMHDLLIRNARAGRYKSLSAEQMQQRLVADLQSVAVDQHMKVKFDPDQAGDPAPAFTPPSKRPSDVPPRRLQPRPVAPEVEAESKMTNYGVAKAAILSGNIGLIRIDTWRPVSPELEERFAAAFELVEDTEALIVDVTRNDGGYPDSVALFLSYLFDREPFLVNRIRWRYGPADEAWTFATVKGPRYGEERPLFVTASADTFSAAEEFTYSIKHLKRAVIVGQTTKGGANPGGYENVGYGFSIHVPRGRAENPITGTNWEGVGVKPDINVATEKAVETAHRLALEAVLKMETDPKRKEAVEKALERVVQSQPILRDPTRSGR